jgi:polynucleotide 5'-kinase involved in rRNA processing
MKKGKEEQADYVLKFLVVGDIGAGKTYELFTLLKSQNLSFGLP